MREDTQETARVSELPFEETGAYPKQVFVKVEGILMWVLVHNKADEARARKLEAWVRKRVDAFRKRQPSVLQPGQLVLGTLLEVSQELLTLQDTEKKRLETLLARLEKLTKSPNLHTSVDE